MNHEEERRRNGDAGPFAADGPGQQGRRGEAGLEKPLAPRGRQSAAYGTGGAGELPDASVPAGPAKPEDADRPIRLPGPGGALRASDTGTRRAPEKPSGSTWTDEQWSAIVTSGSNVLVAAAAGSGKTAVLVERIIRKISADTDVDRLLVATFTKAAAAEMKERIRAALERQLERDPGSEHLRRQLALMGRASITTLHSFCLDAIRRYYPLIGLDPGFRIAGETEAELLRMEVLDAIFEQNYEAGNDGEFMRLVDRFGGERGDEPLYALVLRLYDFASSHPWPEEWLRRTAAAFDVADAEELERSEWAASLAGVVKLALDGAESLLEQALAVARLPSGPDHYIPTLQDDLSLVRSLAAAAEDSGWGGWREAFVNAAFGKLKSRRGDDFDKSLQETAKEARDTAKAIVGDLSGQLFVRTADEFAAELRELAPVMKDLAELVVLFGERFEASKREKGLIDFGDMEHYCLRILRDPSSTPDVSYPSAAALEYRRQFDEILLDEYQDTNMVQEAIVSLLARPGRGNRFMVGDVKQSIYRFRLAEPNLFLRKYKAYTAEDLGAATDVSGEDSRGEGWEASSTPETVPDSAPASAAVRPDDPEAGIRIDLARNFRSRAEVVDGVNDVFRAIMREKAAEMDYDERAELVCGASYPPASEGGPAGRYAVEFALIDRGTNPPSGAAAEDDSDEAGSELSEAAEEALDLQTVQLEARWIAAQIMKLKGEGGAPPLDVYDGKSKSNKALAWRDIVILLRADKQWAPILIEELQTAGIPAYAELSGGYFEATEVETMLSLLRVIDNPYQDIPLAGALRSPIFGLTAEQLAQIRIIGGRASFFDAVRKAAGSDAFDDDARHRLADFLGRLERWRGEARRGALAELLWELFRETGYYDMVGGMPGGVQRQANLRALHDRARQYEATSFRGLFRFLRFIDRMKERGGDLGTARALGEQEDVVRIMSIHKSKGLEFPVVFVAGLGKTFNRQDLNGMFLMHKQLGFGPRFVDGELRVSYPTFPYLAIRERMRLETLAEEMRILYVALTRPKEKMFLVGTVADADKQIRRWSMAADGGGLSDYRLTQARRFIDWLGPLAVRGGFAMTVEGPAELSESAGGKRPDETVDAADIAGPGGLSSGRSGERRLRDWKVGVVHAQTLGLEAAAAAEEPDAAEREAFARRLEAVRALVPQPESPEEAEDIGQRLSWQYPFAAATVVAAKTSVTEMKRLHAEAGADPDAAQLPSPDRSDNDAESDEGTVDEGMLGGEDASRIVESPDPAKGSGVSLRRSAPRGGEYTFRLRRPKFMEERSLTPAEKGTVSHLVMQHIPLNGKVDESVVRETIAWLQSKQMLTAQQAEAVDVASVAAFFADELGRRLLGASWVRRETPFSVMFPASRVYGHDDRGALQDEPVLIQGVVDCMFEDEGELVLLDYKTDSIHMKDWDRAVERHRFQLELYAEAIGRILRRPIGACYVFFFDGGRSVRLF